MKQKKNRLFKSGAQRDSDSDKEDYIECVSFLAMRRYALYMLSKKKLYGRNNWKKGIPIEEYEKSFFRHVQKYFANKDGANLETDSDHLSAAWFNLQGIMHELEKEKLKLKSKK